MNLAILGQSTKRCRCTTVMPTNSVFAGTVRNFRGNGCYRVSGLDRLPPYSLSKSHETALPVCGTVTFTQLELKASAQERGYLKGSHSVLLVGEGHTERHPQQSGDQSNNGIC